MRSRLTLLIVVNHLGSATNRLVERDEKELPTAFLNMLGEFPRSAIGVPFSEHVPDLTAKDDIVDVKKYLEAHYSVLDWA